MRAERVRIENFRSIRNMTVELEDITIMIGANSTGKTTVLDALGLFRPELPGVADDDFARSAGQIRVTLSVAADARAVPARFLRGGTVELQRRFSRGRGQGSGGLWASTMCNRDFDAARGAATPSERAEESRKLLGAYPDFPQPAGKKRWRAEFDEYERGLSRVPEHRGKYRKKFVAVSRGEIDLSRILEVVVVPAARDIAADGEEGSDSHLSRLMDLAIRSSQKNDEEAMRIAQARDRAYSRYMGSVGGTIMGLNRKLGYHARRYMSGAEFTVRQEYPSAPPDAPSASVHMSDGEFMAPIGRAGSGAQRVYLLALLDTIAHILKEGREGRPGRGRASPARLIAIDEPELYQHPQRQQMILRSLVDIVEGDPAVSVVCSTHSPYFVRLERIHSLRLLRKARRGRIRSVTADRLAGIVLPKKRAVRGGAGELDRWLDMSATHWVTEAFFARMAVITEGQGDRSMLLATAMAMGVDLGRHEITMVPATGIENVERFARIFGEFRIPVYVVWDRDRRWDEGRGEAHVKDRRLAGVASRDTFRGSLWETTVSGSFSCVEDNLTAALARDLRGCADLLGGSAEYERLRGAMEQDEGSTLLEAQGAAGGRGAKPRAVYRAQKGVLNNRLNVLRMLGAILERDPKRPESFTAVRIVRQIEEAGKAAASEIERVAYDDGSRTLRIVFRGGQAHDYHGVPRSAYVGLLDAESRDMHYHAGIRGAYRHDMVP